MAAVTLVFRQADDGALVAPPSCGMLAVPDFLAQLQRRVAEGAPVVVDLSEVMDFDVAALRSLVWARRHCQRRGVRFAVVEAPRGVLAGPHETLLRELVPVFPDRRSAREGSSSGPEGSTVLPGQRAASDPASDLASDPGCAVAGCAQPVRTAGRCSRHLLRRFRYRTPFDQQPR